MNKSGNNKWLLGLVVCLCLVIAFQAYYLLKNNNKKNAEDMLTDLMHQNPFSNNIAPDNWDPFENFQRMQKRMDGFFNRDFFGFKNKLPMVKNFSLGDPFQHYDIKEKGNKLIISFNLPGLNETDVDILVEGQTLKVSGTLQQIKANKDDKRMFQTFVINLVNRNSSYFNVVIFKDASLIVKTVQHANLS